MIKFEYLNLVQQSIAMLHPGCTGTESREAWDLELDGRIQTSSDDQSRLMIRDWVMFLGELEDDGSVSVFCDWGTSALHPLITKMETWN